MGQASPGPQGTPKTDLARIIGLIVGVAAVAAATSLQATNKGVIYTVILAAISAISVLGPWLLPLPPSNFASLKQVVSTRIKSSWPLLLFTALILAVASCVTWMVVTGTPLINMLLAAILIALPSLCLILVAIMTIIDLMRKKGSGKGTKLSINWILLKLSVKQMLYILVFLVLLILALSTSLFYTLRLPSLSRLAAYPGKIPSPNVTPSPNIIPSSTSTAPFPTATKQIAPDNTIIYLISPIITQKTPLPIPCSINCVSRLDVVLESVVFENSHSDLLFTFQISNKEANICRLAVNVLRIRGEHNAPYDGDGFRVSHLDAGQVLTVSANFPLTPSPRFSYGFSLVLSCQVNMPMIYEDKTFIFDSYRVSHPQPNPPVAAIIRLINSIMAFVSSPLGKSIFFIVFVFVFASTFIWWRSRPRPFGVLTSIPVVRRGIWEEEEETSSIILGAERSLARKLLSRSTVSSEELVELAGKEHFDLNGGEFDLVFKKGGQVYIRARGHFSIRLRRHEESRYEERGIDVSSNGTVPLLDGDIINVEGDDIAVFHI